MAVSCGPEFLGIPSNYLAQTVVVDRLAEFYSPEEARIWLYARHPLLDGSRPIDLIREGDGDRLLGVIDSLSDPTFT